MRWFGFVPHQVSFTHHEVQNECYHEHIDPKAMEGWFLRLHHNVQSEGYHEHRMQKIHHPMQMLLLPYIIGMNITCN
jgi:hypothetical protein